MSHVTCRDVTCNVSTRSILCMKKHLKNKQPRFNSLLILSIIWLLGALCDRIWFALDNSIPAWDQADYLTGTLNYWRALENPQWWDKGWWESFWLLSSKIPPLTYIITGVIQHIFGTGADQATLVMLIFSAILLGSVFGLGTVLFGESVGLLAAGLCQIIPGLYRFRLEFLLDYPLAAVVTLSFCCFTIWLSVETAETQRKQRKGSSPAPLLPCSPALVWAVAFGLSLGVALMVKQTALLFLLTPIVWVVVEALFQRRWQRLVQLFGSLCLSVLVFGFWYRTNWLTILTSGKRATIDSAIAEGDAPLNTLQAWTFYWHQLPYQVSLPLLVVPILGLLLCLIPNSIDAERRAVRQFQIPNGFRQTLTSIGWLGVFLIGGYLLSSLNVNKDPRYVLPYLPVLTVLLAYGLMCFSGVKEQRVRYCTIGLALVLMLFNLFPVGGFVGDWLTQALSSNAQHYPYMKEELPHRQIIAQIIETQPYLRSTLGVLPSTAAINQHNFNYYGALQNFQVYGRQVGTKKKYVYQDVHSLEWFLTKTGKQGSVPKAQAAIVKSVEQGYDFELNKSWKLSDGNLLKLYHQRTPAIEVKPVQTIDKTPTHITLSQITLPQTAPPGVPVPVTYEWFGSWEELQQGLVLLTWESSTTQIEPKIIRVHPRASAVPNQQWIHDHGIAMGALHSSAKKPDGTFQVTERLAMLPPDNIIPGTYSLQAIYLNRLSGESYPITVPKVILKIDPLAAPTPAPELDLVTQLRLLGASLPKGTEALEQVFEEVARINQYDPIQDYLVQARLTLEYRLQHFSLNRDLTYALALANVLQQRVNGAIASLKQVIQLDPENPYAHAYLAFTQLYNWQPKAAEKTLQLSLTKNPNLPEFKALSGIAALMQGNLIKAWHIFQELNINN
jgi:4-amino-4-deoxy-L-arabinose transferase-like glycosyltransferase